MYSILCKTNAITVPPAAYCNCCNYSAIKIMPVFATSASFNVCSGSLEAPKPCSCSAKGLEVSYDYMHVHLTFINEGIIRHFILHYNM